MRVVKYKEIVKNNPKAKIMYFYLYQATDIKSGKDFSMFFSNLDTKSINVYLNNLSERLKK